MSPNAQVIQHNISKMERARDLAIKANRALSDLYQSLDNETLEDIRIQPNPDNNILSLSDQLCDIKYELIAKTDGRPKPFSVDACGAPEYERWAVCESPGYKTAAFFSGEAVEMTIEELERLRSWIDSVVDWHRANPNRVEYK